MKENTTTVAKNRYEVKTKTATWLVCVNYYYDFQINIRDSNICI